MKIIRATATAACMAQLSLVICAILPAGALSGGQAARPAPAAHSVAVNIVEYGPGSQ
jgi:hypothetical protein